MRGQEKRDRIVSLRLTAGEHRRLTARAEKAGMTVSDYARHELAAERWTGVRWSDGPRTATVAGRPTFMVWHDGAAGQTWPALATA